MRYSRAYKNAPMPWAQHLFAGIFIHQGSVDGTRLSHGCIRLPKSAAKEFYQQTSIGMPVVISGTDPRKK